MIYQPSYIMTDLIVKVFAINFRYPQKPYIKDKNKGKIFYETSIKKAIHIANLTP